MHRRDRQATLGQKIYKGMKIVGLTDGDLVSRKHRFDALLDRLLSVKADDRIVDLRIWNQLSKGVDVPIRQFEKAASQVSWALDKESCLREAPNRERSREGRPNPRLRFPSKP